MGRPIVEIGGMKFTRWTVIWPVGKNHTEVFWLCLCECGRFSHVSGNALRNGTSKSCGCLARELSSKRIEGRIKHGHTTHTSMSYYYAAYHSAKNRCNNSRNKYYHNYGGRGIQFKFTSFEQFLEVMGPRPTAKHTLDRENNNGNYEPGNCRWATRHEQNLNTRRSKNGKKEN